jgi:hypothetical protein
MSYDKFQLSERNFPIMSPTQSTRVSVSRCSPETDNLFRFSGNILQLEVVTTSYEFSFLAQIGILRMRFVLPFYTQ